MNRPKKPPLDRRKTRHPGIRTKIYVREDMIGQGKIMLLKRVGELGSISAAAKEFDLDYRRAWFLLDTLQRSFSAPLFISERGGPGSGGTELTELGIDLIARYEAHATRVQEISVSFLDWLDRHQRTVSCSQKTGQ